jgi:hypothetical protein
MKTVYDNAGAKNKAFFYGGLEVRTQEGKASNLGQISFTGLHLFPHHGHLAVFANNSNTGIVFAHFPTIFVTIDQAAISAGVVPSPRSIWKR